VRFIRGQGEPVAGEAVRITGGKKKRTMVHEVQKPVGATSISSPDEFSRKSVSKIFAAKEKKRETVREFTLPQDKGFRKAPPRRKSWSLRSNSGQPAISGNGEEFLKSPTEVR